MLNINLMPWRQAKRRRAQFVRNMLIIILVCIVALTLNKHSTLTHRVSGLTMAVNNLKTRVQQNLSSKIDRTDLALLIQLQAKYEFFFKKLSSIFLGANLISVEMSADHLLFQATFSSLHTLQYFLEEAHKKQINFKIKSLKNLQGMITVDLFDKNIN